MEPKTYKERQDLLGLALDIHMSFTGSYPDLSDEELEHATTFIRNRVANWSFNGKHTVLFDTAVKMLLTVAVHEGELEKAKRESWKSAPQGQDDPA